MGPHMQAADTADQKLADQRNGKHIVKKNQKQISLLPHPHVKGKPGNYVPSTDMFAKTKSCLQIFKVYSVITEILEVSSCNTSILHVKRLLRL